MTTNMIQDQRNSGSVYGENELPSLKKVTSSIVRETAYLAGKAIDFTAGVLLDVGRGVDYTTQWISDYSNMSPQMKEKAGNVKIAADRFNLFGTGCDLFCAAKALMTTQITRASEAIDIVGSYISASSDFAGRLDDFKVVSLGAAKPFIGGLGAIAETSLGFNGVREAVQENIEGERPIVSAVLKVAKNVALVALAVLSGIASCFASVAASFTQLPFFILTAASLYLALKITGCFYDKLALPSPLEIASKV